MDVDIELLHADRKNPEVVFADGCIELFKGLTDLCLYDTGRFAGGYWASDNQRWAVLIVPLPDSMPPLLP